MACDEGKQLKEEYATTTRAVGAYADSLKGVARMSLHYEESKRLDAENDTARRAFQEHREYCPVCRQDRNL
jgi:hypothetical protein